MKPVGLKKLDKEVAANSNLIHQTENNQFEIYLINDRLLKIVDLRRGETWSINKLEDIKRWERIVRTFRKFGIKIE